MSSFLRFFRFKSKARTVQTAMLHTLQILLVFSLMESHALESETSIYSPMHTSEAYSFAPSHIVTLKKGAKVGLLNHQCFMSETGDVFCGVKEAGKISEITDSYFNQIPKVKNAIDLTAGDEHFCALLESKKVSCWGKNNEGQIGTVGTNFSNAPVEVPDLSNVMKIRSKHSTTCAVLETGGLKCWGDFDSATMNKTLSGFTDISDIDFYNGDGCVLLKNGLLFCWGGLTRDSENGISEEGGRFILDGVKGVSVGRSFACALMLNGIVRCWGGNANGELADRTTIPGFEPTPVDGIKGANTISAGEGEACAVLRNGKVKCWGSQPNSSGAPYEIKGISNASSVSISRGSRFILSRNGDIHLDRITKLHFGGCGISGRVDPIPAMESRLMKDDPELLVGVDKIDSRVNSGILKNVPEAYLIAAYKSEVSDAEQSVLFKKALSAAFRLNDLKILDLVVGMWPKGMALNPIETSETRKFFIGSDRTSKSEELASLLALLGLKTRDTYYLDRAEDVYRTLGQQDVIDSFYREVYESDLNESIRAKFLLKTIKHEAGRDAVLENLSIYKKCVLLNSDFKVACAIKLGKQYKTLKMNDLAKFYLSKASPMGSF